MKYLNIKNYTFATLIIFCSCSDSPVKSTPLINEYPDTAAIKIVPEIKIPNILIISMKDTFTYNNRTFRILKYTQSKNVKIEYLEKSKWVDNVDIDVYSELETKVDFNKDGYNDIFSQSQNSWSYVNFYIPSKRIFSKQYQLLGDAETVIDSKRKLYSLYRAPYGACNNYVSQLMDYKHSVPNIYYVLEGETECEPGNIKKVKLYKYDNEKDSLIFLNSFMPKDSSQFDDMGFWKKHYKRLQGYND